jgi:4-amino-4-deoxy-L-arabinose transferase-like glycosyltransferase
MTAIPPSRPSAFPQPTAATGDATSPPSSARINTPHLLLAVIIFGIALRLMLAYVLGDRAEPVSGATDQVSYDMLAQRVVAGRGFSFPTAWYPFTQADKATAHWSYLYTLYLAGIYEVVGHHPLVARVAQALLSGLGTWLTFVIGRRLFSPWAGLAAAALHASYAYLVFFNVALMTQTFYIIALLAVLALVLRMRSESVVRDWVLLGFLIGIGTLLRQTLLLFTPVLLAWLVWARTGRLGWRGPATTLMVVAALILPWTIRNYLAFGDVLLLNSNGGFFFYSSNHPNQGVDFDPNYVAPIPARLADLPEPALDRALYREAAAFIVSDPLRFIRLSLSRVPEQFWLLPSRQSSTSSNLARLCSFTLYLPFMVAGLLLSFRKWRECLPLYLYVGFDTTLHLISWSAPRYRLPSDAIMIVFAGLAVEKLAARLGLVTERQEGP